MNQFEFCLSILKLKKKKKLLFTRELISYLLLCIVTSVVLYLELIQ